MSFQIVSRLIGVPVTILALTLTFVDVARAGGGDPPTGPSVGLGVPTAAVDRDGRAVVTVPLTCKDEAAAEAIVVHITLAVDQARGRTPAAADGATDATCVDGTQPVTFALASVTDRVFRPGLLHAIPQIDACSSKGCGHAIGEFDLLARPLRPHR